jgi:hypothetical protein
MPTGLPMADTSYAVGNVLTLTIFDFPSPVLHRTVDRAHAVRRLRLVLFENG